ncbi:MAG: glycosyltransferase family 2 protein [Pseudomonadota bacterium]
MVRNGGPADPVVSVVVAAYQAEAFVTKAIASALDQAGLVVEVLISDDASRDDTVAVAEAEAANDPRIRVLRAPRNGGPSVARNRAIDAARGRWIAVLDSDDRFLPGRLARMVAFAEDRGADIAFDLFAECDVAGNRIGGKIAPPVHVPEEWDLARWASDNRMYDGEGTGYLKPLFRRDFLQSNGIRYDETLRNSEDYAIVAEVLARGGAVWCMPETGYLYTRREGSLSHRIGQRELSALIVADAAFRARHPGLDAAAVAALDDRLRSLDRAMTLATTIDALKERSPIRAAGTIAREPGAWMLFMRWFGEMAGKRVNALVGRHRRG